MAEYATKEDLGEWTGEPILPGTDRALNEAEALVLSVLPHRVEDYINYLGVVYTTVPEFNDARERLLLAVRKAIVSQAAAIVETPEGGDLLGESKSVGPLSESKTYAKAGGGYAGNPRRALIPVSRGYLSKAGLLYAGRVVSM